MVFLDAHRIDILLAIHDSTEGRHIGRHATQRKVLEGFWWPKMFSAICRYVANRKVCQQYKRLPGTPPGMLTPIPPLSRIFHVYRPCIDHVGPLPITRRGSRYVLVALGYLSIYVEVQSVPTLATSHIIALLRERSQCQHGFFEKLIFDRGTSFTSQSLSLHLENVGVEHHFSSACHPQTNGLA